MINYETNYRKISIIAFVAIGIAAMMIPGASLTSTAYAHSGGKISHSGNVHQSVSQSNSISSSNSGSGGSSHADGNTQVNSASNSADVHIHNGGHDKKSGDSGTYHKKGDKKNGGSISHSGNVNQDITQSNSISASNSGSGGSATANDNTQVNDATNTASVDIHNGGNNNGGQVWLGDSGSGGSISHSGNVHQSIDQSNSITATNTGSGGSATANDNTQVNDATNTASVDIHNHGGGSISHSGNVDQSITQSNTISATNSPPPPLSACLIPCSSADASGNTQVNSADNNATVSIGSH
jgi:hypothetical protein